MRRPSVIVKEIPLKVVPELITSCEECPYTLPCYQGKFFNNEEKMQGFTSYCPGCEVLRHVSDLMEYVEASPTMSTGMQFSVRCVFRNNEAFVREYLAGWDHAKSLTLLPMLWEDVWVGKTTLRAPDPGPTVDPIHVAMCARCCENNVGLESKRHTLETYACEQRHKKWLTGEFY